VQHILTEMLRVLVNAGNRKAVYQNEGALTCCRQKDTGVSLVPQNVRFPGVIKCGPRESRSVYPPTPEGGFMRPSNIMLELCAIAIDDLFGS